MRQREPGFYVRVEVAPGASRFLRSELLDGPWPTRERAERRAQEIVAQGRRPADCRVVRVAEDGLTILDHAG